MKIEEVDGLSDETLRATLIELGEKVVGPVVGTTRSIYQNRLKALLGANSAPAGEQDTAARPSAIPVPVQTPIAQTNSPKATPVKAPPLRDVETTKEADAVLSARRQSPRKGVQQQKGMEILKQATMVAAKNLENQFTAIREKRDLSPDDSDMRGEEGSRQLSFEESSCYFSPGRRYDNGDAVPAMRKSQFITNKSVASTKSYARCYIVGVLAVVLAVFGFFVVQNIAAIKNGEANFEEL